jgi:hypothetical protein
VFPRQLRFVGPKNLLQQLQEASGPGKFVVVEGRLYIGAYRLLVTKVGDDEGVFRQ